MISTTRGADNTLRQVFKGRRERTGADTKHPPLPTRQPHLRAIRFRGQ